MWYFSWILGMGLALMFGVLNAMWFEIREGKPVIDPRARPEDEAPRGG